MPASAASGGSDGAACPAPASRAFWPPARHAPPSSTPICSMTRPSCRRCWRCSQAGEADLVVGSRYIEGGSADSFNKQRAGASALATEVAKARAAGQDRRSHERLLHDPPRPLRTTGAAALDAGLQDPARYRRHRARRSARQGNSLHLRLAAAWREQARFHGGAGFPGAGAGEADPRRGVAALPVVCDGRLDRPVRAFRRALRRARSLRSAVSGSAGRGARSAP